MVMFGFQHRSSNLYSCHGPTINPWSSSMTRDNGSEGKDEGGEEEEERDEWIVCGGSSGGSAAAVATGMCDL